MPSLYTICNGDCRDILHSLDPETVHLAVTSPPSNCGKKYEGSPGDDMPWRDYWDFTDQWLREVFTVLVPGGRLAVNLPWWMGKKPRQDVPYQLKTIALDVGFLFLDKIIWVKGNENNVHTSGGWGGGGCGWGTWMSPSGPAIRCASEPILVFAKETRGRGMVSGAGRGDCIKGDMTKEEFLTYTLDTWFIRGESDSGHPAVWPVEIPRRLIKLYTYPGEMVLDPFCGTGKTGVAAIESDRRFIGVDTSAVYCEVARGALQKVGGARS